MSMLARDESMPMGFASLGSNVRVSRRASVYGAARIAPGNDVRVDDFCVLSAGEGGIILGNNVHIAVGSTLIGAGRITLEDFAGLSPTVSIYSSSDDCSGAAMTNPAVQPELTNIHAADVRLGKHVIVGRSDVIPPGVTVEEGVAIGALSLVHKSCGAFGIHAGNPRRRIRARRREMLEVERKFRAAKASRTRG